MRPGLVPHPPYDLQVCEIRQYAFPTTDAIERFERFGIEQWVNTPQPVFGGRCPWEVAQSPAGLWRVEEEAKEWFGDQKEKIAMVLATASPLPRPDKRRAEVYRRSGGLLNIFLDWVSEEDDELWQRLVRERLEARSFPDQATRLAVLHEIERRWLETPSELFSNLTPELVWAGPGPVEGKLLIEFLESHTAWWEDQSFETRGEALKESLFFLRRFQLQPRNDFPQRMAGEVVMAERRRMLERKKAVVMD